MWFYCVKTGKEVTAHLSMKDSRRHSFLGHYQHVLERVVAERGQISDDGDKIVDKFSGYTIRMIEFDDAEGFDDAGYKIVSSSLNRQRYR